MIGNLLLACALSGAIGVSALNNVGQNEMTYVSDYFDTSFYSLGYNVFNYFNNKNFLTAINLVNMTEDGTSTPVGETFGLIYFFNSNDMASGGDFYSRDFSNNESLYYVADYLRSWAFESVLANTYNSFIGFSFRGSMNSNGSHLSFLPFGYINLITDANLSLHNVLCNYFTICLYQHPDISWDLSDWDYSRQFVFQNLSGRAYDYPYIEKINYGYYFSPYILGVNSTLNLADTSFGISFGFGYFDDEENSYTDGYNNGYTTGYDNGVKDGYQSGTKDGYDEGYTVGRNDGLNISQQGTFKNLLGAIADTPVRMLFSLFSFDLFGTSMIVVVLSFLTGIIVIKIVKKFL